MIRFDKRRHRLFSFGTSAFKSAFLLACVVTCFVGPLAGASFAQGITDKDIQIIGRALGFVQGGPTGQTEIALVYDSASEASRQHADAVAAMLGGGKKAGKVVLSPKVVSVGEVANTQAPVILILDGVDSASVFSRVSNRGVVTIGESEGCLNTKTCVMSVESEPRVRIKISRRAAQVSNVEFASAFRAMIEERE